VVGYIVYELIAGSQKGSRRLNVNLLAVHPDHHRRGIGQSLMKKAFEFADKNGITLVTLRCYQMNEFANKFYQALPGGDKLGDIVEPPERTDSTRKPQDKHDMYTYVFSLKSPATGSSDAWGQQWRPHQTN
jgi:N-acetylglutamate synthase-like GNAT family acetyltransferase